MHKSKACLVEVPDDFDVASYDAIADVLAKIVNPNDAARPNNANVHQVFASAWNGVGYRVAAAWRYDAEFAASIAKGAAPGAEERFIQERALFGCAACNLSAIECFSMAAYSVGCALGSASFPIADPKNLIVYPRQVAAAFKTDFSNELFTRILVDVESSTALRRLGELRNFLAHRGVLPRRHFLSNNGPDRPSAVPSHPKALAKDFDYTAELSDNTSREHTAWVMTTLNCLLNALNEFLHRAAVNDA